MIKVVCNILCMGRCPIQLQQSSILNSIHNKHVIRILSYFNFSTNHMNRVGLLSNLHKGQQAPFQLRKIEYIVQKKISESMQLESNGSHSRGFEVRIFCKIHYAIYIFIEVFEKISLECHVRGFTYAKKPCIFPRTICSAK
jgi:hypothetical protein